MKQNNLNFFRRTFSIDPEKSFRGIDQFLNFRGGLPTLEGLCFFKGAETPEETMGILPLVWRLGDFAGGDSGYICGKIMSFKIAPTILIRSEFTDLSKK